MIYVTRRSHFSAAHRLFHPGWTDEENLRAFGKCANPSGHGHNYFVDVTVAGEVNPETGYLIDLKILQNIVDTHFIEKVDHRHLNHDVDFLRGINPTTENIAIACWKQIAPHITDGRLYAVRVYETDRNYAEYRGEPQ